MCFISFSQEGVKKKNKTVLAMSYNQVASMYKSVFDNANTAALALTGIAGIGLGKIASYSFKHYKTAQVKFVRELVSE
mgnify:CR=1 FL=1